MTVKYFLLIALFPVASHAAEIPLESARWVALSFSKIPANQVLFNEGVLSVNVKSSAGPIVFKLESPRKVAKVAVRGTFKGAKKLETTEFDEDSILRVGLVAAGDRTLSAVKRVFAADWVKKLFALAPPKTGLDKIYFFNATNRPHLVGKSREHPKSDLLVEKIVKSVAESGDFVMDFAVDTPIDTVALWLSIDGDDTKSDFELLIKSITID